MEVAVESSATHSDSKTAALNVGGKVSKFEVKTKADTTADTTVPAPDTLNPFAFTVRNNIAPSTPVVSNQIIIA